MPTDELMPSPHVSFDAVCQAYVEAAQRQHNQRILDNVRMQLTPRFYGRSIIDGLRQEVTSPIPISNGAPEFLYPGEEQ